MATPSPRPRQPEDAGPPRAQPPIRWPHPDRVSVALVVLWAIGVAVALFVPAALVSPNVRTAPPRDVWTAFAVTILGAAIMITASAVLWRHRKDPAVLIMGAIPAFVTIVGGAILTASKLTGT